MTVPEVIDISDLPEHTQRLIHAMLDARRAGQSLQRVLNTIAPYDTLTEEGVDQALTAIARLR